MQGLDSHRVVFAGSSQSSQSETGAAFVEFALVSLLFLTLFFTFLDLAHYLTARSLMIKAAQDALQIAVKSEDFQVDLRSTQAADKEYEMFKKVRDDIITEASRLPLATIASPDGSDAFLELKNFSMTYNLSDGGQDTVEQIPVAVLRPGESWTWNKTGEAVEHPYTLDENDKYSSVLRREPIIVQLRAMKRFFVPLFYDAIPIEVTAVGWAQAYPEVGFNVAEFLNSGGPGEDDDGQPCEKPDFCPAQYWKPDPVCRCCNPETGQENCFFGTTYSFDLCRCDCTDAPPCPNGQEREQWNCSCKPCERPTNLVCPDGEEWVQASCGCGVPQGIGG